MGNTGSFTAKATLHSSLYPFTKWGTKELHEFLLRGQNELPEVFGLRRHEFEFLIGAESIGFVAARGLFQDIFDTDRNGLVDKMEVMCIVCMCTKVSSKEKLEFFFDLFNFNEKGYLNISELILLIMSVSRGAFKIDRKFTPPSVKMIKELAKEAIDNFGKIMIGSLRKPELVDYVVHNPDITAYLECWRGHAAQVLLPEPKENETAKQSRYNNWRDLSFPCNETAIAPNRSWYSLGLPPSFFIKWLRREKVHSATQSNNNNNKYTAMLNYNPGAHTTVFTGGMSLLFAHEESFLKTVDRKRVYKGEGCLGMGYLQSGFLADLFLVNTLAMLSSRPDCCYHLFALTGQEEQGRYCLRFYESGGWRSVYIDDRLPVTMIDHHVLGLHSSCEREAWVTLIEKGLAKYLGSYGHIAAVSLRYDALLYTLRLCTGGHCYREFVGNYEWRSIQEDVSIHQKDGLGLIQQLLQEGSMIGFLRSSSMAYVHPHTKVTGAGSAGAGGGAGGGGGAGSSSNANKGSNHPLPPMGRLFPVVGIKKNTGTEATTTTTTASSTMNKDSKQQQQEQGKKSYVQLVLRDGHGLIGDAEPRVNPDSGHCNTFCIKVEDIPVLYDCMIIVRYPDCLRTKLKNWKTEVYSSITQQQQQQAPQLQPRLLHQPAVFKITIKKGNEGDGHHIAAGIGGRGGGVGSRKGSRGGNTAKNGLASKAEIDRILAEADDEDQQQQDEGNEDDDDEAEEANGNEGKDHKKKVKKREQDVNSRLLMEGKNLANSMRVKERYDFTRHGYSFDQRKQSTSNNNSNLNNNSTVNPLSSIKDQLVDFSFTLSTACDWSFSGSWECGAQLRYHLIPSEKTLIQIQKRQTYIQDTLFQQQQLKYQAKLKQEQLLAVGDAAATSTVGATLLSSSAAKGQQRPRSSSGGNILDGSNHSNTPGTPTNNNNNNKDNNNSNIHILEEMKRGMMSSWHAQSLALEAGEYYLICDIVYSPRYPYTQARLISLPRDLSEAPWLETTLVESVHHYYQQFGRLDVHRMNTIEHAKSSKKVHEAAIVIQTAESMKTTAAAAAAAVIAAAGAAVTTADDGLTPVIPGGGSGAGGGGGEDVHVVHLEGTEGAVGEDPDGQDGGVKQQQQQARLTSSNQPAVVAGQAPQAVPISALEQKKRLTIQAQQQPAAQEDLHSGGNTPLVSTNKKATTATAIAPPPPMQLSPTTRAMAIPLSPLPPAGKLFQHHQQHHKGHGHGDDLDDNDDDDQSISSLAKLEREIFKQHDNDPTAMDMNVPFLRDLHLDHHIWLEASTSHSETLHVQPSSMDQIPPRLLKKYDPFLATIPIQPQTWPICPENQQEVSTRELYNYMTILKEECEVIGSEFMQLASKYKEQRKKKLKQQQQQQLK